jgi:putative peptide zinc metalloprotease protein
VLCRSCRRQVAKGAVFCASCGAPAAGDTQLALEVVLPDGLRVPVNGTLTIGRSADNSIQLDDRSVSRHHARVVAGGDGAFVEDAGSTHGTFLDGRPIGARTRLRDGARVHVGNVEFRVERRREESEAGRTIVVRPGASLLISAVGATEVDAGATSFGFRPRVRSGWALKRLEEGEGSQRWVLKDLRGEGAFVRMGDEEAAVFKQLDGQHALPELITDAEERFGPGGATRLARLLADLGERGLLEGVEAGASADGDGGGGLAKALKPRELEIKGLGRIFDRIYLAGGWLLFTRAALWTMAAVGIAGLVAFGWLIARRYGTPFVVADRIGIGALIFLLGRFVVVAFHELAHGLVVSSFGRRVSRAGLKLMLVFPFAFVDTSDGWFEPRRRRFAISAAGPASDLLLGGIFALGAAFLGGTVRDVFFQLAFAAYVGAFSNLNPLLDRDGYHMLVDRLGEPGLRRRARAHLAAVLSCRGRAADEPRALLIYAVAGLAWTLAAVAFVIVMTTRYYGVLTSLAPEEVVWGVLGSFYLLMFVPVLVMVGRPLLERVRRRGEPQDVVA